MSVHLLTTRKKSFIWNLSLFLVDAIILFGTAAWWAVFSRYTIPPVLVFALLLRWKRFAGFLPVRIFYGLVVFMFADAVFLGFFPLFCVSKTGLFFSIITVVICLGIMIWRRKFSARAVGVSFIPALFIVVGFVAPANGPSTVSECAKVRNTPGIETLVDVTQLSGGRGIPRYLVRRPARDDFIVTYRFSGGYGELDVAGEQFDRETGTLISALDVPQHSEVVGILYDEELDRLYTVNTNRDDPQHPKTFHVFDSELNPLAMLDFPTGGKGDYSAYLIKYRGNILVESEGMFEYDVTENTLDYAKIDRSNGLFPLSGCRLIAQTGFEQLSESRIMVAGGGSPAIYLATFAPDACAHDLSTGEMQTTRNMLGGGWDIAHLQDRDELLLSGLWNSNITVLDATTFAFKRMFSFGPCMRAVGYDGTSGIAYAHVCFEGELIGFDPESGDIVSRQYVGRNARKIYHFEDWGTIILSGCGILRVQSGFQNVQP